MIILKSRTYKILILVLFATVFILISNDECNTEFATNEIDGSIEASGSWTVSRVIIDENDPNYSWSKISSENPWCYGSGTQLDPYIIENITINYHYVYRGGLLEIRNSNAYFVIRSCNLYRTRDLFGSGIFLLNTTNGHITENYCSNRNGNGIGLEESNYNLISNNNIIDCDGEGIDLVDSDYNVISNNFINSERLSGILVYYSQYNEISNNTILNCNYGTWFWWGARHNSFTDNYLSGNGR